MKNLLTVMLIFVAVTNLYATGELYIEDGSSHSTRDWSLETEWAVSVNEDGAGGGGGGGASHPDYGDTEDFTTFWFKGDGYDEGPTAGWRFPSYERTDFVDELAGDLSLYMDMSVKLRMRTSNWYNDIFSFYADINHIQFIFDGIVGGLPEQAVFRIFPIGDAAHGWTYYVWQDIEVQLDNGFFTMTGSTAPSGTQSCLDVQHTFTAGEALEFWQNITGMRVYMQVHSWHSNPADAMDNWFDIEYLYFVPPIPTTCEEALTLGYGTTGDLNDDCYVNLADIEKLAAAWLDCIDPELDDCSHPWLP